MANSDCFDDSSVAVAVQFDEALDKSPSVSAIGERSVAKSITRTARRFGVPIKVNDRLAKKLSNLEIEQSVPEEYYYDLAALIVDIEET